MNEKLRYTDLFRAFRDHTPSQVLTGPASLPAADGPAPLIYSPSGDVNPMIAGRAVVPIIFALAVVTGIVGHITGLSTGEQIGWAINVLLFLGTWPVLRWLVRCLRYKRVLASEYLQLGQARPLVALWGTWMTSYMLLGAIWTLVRGFHEPTMAEGGSELMAATGIFAWLGMPFVMSRVEIRQQRQPAKVLHSDAPVLTTGFGLWVGEATGRLLSQGHGVGISPGHMVGLTLEDACQNIAIFGGIGSGKTTRAIQPLLVQLLDQECGGLIFDIKGDFKHSVDAIASETGREISLVGPGHAGLHLLDGLTPETASSFLKSCLLLNGSGKGEAFWVDTATELCRNSLGVLSYLDGHYDLHSLHDYVFDLAKRAEWDAEALERINTFDGRDQRLLRSYLTYHENVFSSFDEKVVAGVKASVAQILAPFNHPDLIDAFCVAGDSGANLAGAEQGDIFVVDMPLSRWGLGGKVAYTLIKLRFFNLLQSRSAAADWNQRKGSALPLFFLCDEYQEIVSASRDGLSDLSFWDKSRSNRCVGIVSSQSVSSFYAAIGDRELADTVLQNFRQQICFRTEDESTIKRLNNLVGRVDVARYSYTQGEGTSSQPMAGTGQSQHESTQVSYQERAVFNPQLFRELGPDRALCLLSIGGRAADDVLTLTPVFV